VKHPRAANFAWDLLEDDGRFSVTETQKSVGRVREIQQALRTREAVGNFRAGILPPS